MRYDYTEPELNRLNDDLLKYTQANPVRICLDMDGVISDFGAQYHALTGIHPVDTYGDTSLKTPEELKLKDELFNHYIDSRGFVEAPMMDDAPLLLGYLNRLLELKFIRSIEICSSAGGAARQDEVRAQKMEWLHRHGLGGLTAHIVSSGKKKATVINPLLGADLLIDDTQFVLNNFCRHGGYGIWHTDAASTISQLKPAFLLNLGGTTK